MSKKKLQSAMDVIEPARTYFIASNDKKSQPQYVGNRVKLEFVLSGVKSDMVIITSGDNKGKRCLVLLDFTGDEILQLINNANKKINKIKQIKEVN